MVQVKSRRLFTCWFAGALTGVFGALTGRIIQGELCMVLPGLCRVLVQHVECGLDQTIEGCIIERVGESKP